jgi:hypothetical protein
MNRERVREHESRTSPPKIARPIVSEIESLRPSGQRLPETIREPIARTYGHDFREVRLHSGARSDQLATRLDADAFTVGKDVFLGARATGSTITHEVLHTSQAPAARLDGLQAGSNDGFAEQSVRASMNSGMLPAAPAIGVPTLYRRPRKATDLPPKEALEEPAGKDAKAAGAPDGSVRTATQETAGAEGGKMTADALKDPDAPKTESVEEEAAPQPTPETDPNFQAVVQRTKKVASGQRAHKESGGDLAGSAQRATNPPKNERMGQASANEVTAMKTDDPPAFEAEAFVTALEEKIDKDVPKDDADKVESFAKDDHQPNRFNEDLKSDAQGRRAKTDGELRGATKAKPKESSVDAKKPEDMVTPEAGEKPSIANAGQATPSPRPDAAFRLDEGPKALDETMAAEGVTDEQLRKSNEPEFNSAADGVADVKKDATESPAITQAAEAKVLGEAKIGATGKAGLTAGAMFGARGGKFGDVKQNQEDTKTNDQREREEIAKEFQEIFNDTQGKVSAQLDKVTNNVTDRFDKEAEENRKTFADSLERAIDDYKEERHSGFTGKLLAVKDYVAGLPDEVEEVYRAQREIYVRSMRTLIKSIAKDVAKGLNDALQMIKDGRQRVKDKVDSLKGKRKKIAEDAAKDIEQQFTTLTGEVSAKRDELIQSLATKYTENLKQVDELIEQKRQENSGLVNKVIGAIKGVIKTIIELKNMLLRTLSRAAQAIGMIISDPIGFLGNLIGGVKRGLGRFIDNIGKHLLNGLIGWLFGALAEAGIQLPTTFDLKGILGLILQVLGLTYSNIRSRAVRLVGDKIVGALESTAEVFQILVTEGPAGLLKFIKDKIETLKDTMMDEIKGFVLEKIVMAGIQWVIGLLNPAGAFIKACKAIYDIIMFFVERGSQIMALVNAIIDSIVSIASGNIEVAAEFIENAMAKAVPVIISFLAALLGVGGISEKIKSTIHKIQAPINKAIDWVISQAVKLFKAAGNALGSLFGKKEKPAAEKPKEQLDDPSGAKTLAIARLHQEATSSHSVESLRTIVGRIRKDLAPQGLKKLDLGPQSEDGQYPIMAEASNYQQIATASPPDTIVEMNAKITLDEAGGAPVDERGAPMQQDRATSMATGKTPQQMGLSKPWMPKAHGGFAMVDSRTQNEIFTASWNTGRQRPAGKDKNRSHAEWRFDQFVRNKGSNWVPRIRRIDVRLNESPCKACAPMLDRLAGFIQANGSPATKKDLTIHADSEYKKPGVVNEWSMTVGPREADVVGIVE